MPTPKDRIKAMAALRDAAHKLNLHIQETRQSVQALAELLHEATVLAQARPDEAVRILSKAHTAEYNLTGDCAIVAELTERLGLTELFEAHEDDHIDELLEQTTEANLDDDAEETRSPVVIFHVVCLSCDHERTTDKQPDNNHPEPCPMCGSTSNAVSTPPP